MGEGKRILLVDGRRELARPLKHALKQAGHACYWAQAAEEGVLAAGLYLPEVVVMSGKAEEGVPWNGLAAELRERMPPTARLLGYGIPEGGSADHLERIDAPLDAPALAAAIRATLAPAPVEAPPASVLEPAEALPSSVPELAGTPPEAPQHGDVELDDLEDVDGDVSLGTGGFAAIPDAGDLLPAAAPVPVMARPVDVSPREPPPGAAPPEPFEPEEPAPFEPDLDASDLLDHVDRPPADPVEAGHDVPAAGAAPETTAPAVVEASGEASGGEARGGEAHGGEAHGASATDEPPAPTPAPAPGLDLVDPFATAEHIPVAVPTRTGDLAETPAWRLLWQLHEAQVTGELVVEVPEGRLQIFLEGGAIVGATGGGPDATLGRVMVRRGVLPEDEYRRALAEIATSDTEKRLGEVLVARGAITQAELEEGLVAHVEEKVLQTFARVKAPWALYDGAGPGGAPRPRLSVAELVRAGLARLPEELLHAHLVPHRGAFPVGDAESLPAPLAADAAILDLLASMDGTRSLGDLVGVGSGTRAADALALATMGCVHLRTIAALPARPEPPRQPLPLPDRINEFHARAVGRSYYEALGVPRDASPEAIAEAADAARALVSPQSVAGLGPQTAELAKALELRKLFRAIVRTLADPASRAAYDADLPPAPETVPAAPVPPLPVPAPAPAVDGIPVDAPRPSVAVPAVGAAPMAPGPPAAVPARDRKEAFRVQDLVHRAEELLKAGRYGDARAVFEEAGEASSVENAEIIAGLGYALFMGAEPASRAEVADDALRRVKHAIDLRPQLAPAAFYAGEILRLGGKEDEAARYYRHAVQIDPLEARYRDALAALTPAAAERPAAAVQGRYLVLASDLVVAEAPEAVGTFMRAVHRRGFPQALSSGLTAALGSAGIALGREAFSFETRGKSLAVIPLAEAESIPVSVDALLGFAAGLRAMLAPHMDKALAQAQAQGHAAAMARVRVGIVAGAGAVEGSGDGRRLSGPLLAHALQVLGRDQGAMTTDRGTLKGLLGVDTREAAAEPLKRLGFAIEDQRDTAAGGLHVFQLHLAGGAPTTRTAERPARPLNETVDPEDLMQLQELADATLQETEGDLLGVFEELAAMQEAPKQGLWGRMVGKASDAPDAYSVQLRTRLFEPILQGSRISLGHYEVARWIKLLASIGGSYADALFAAAMATEAAAAPDQARTDLLTLRPGSMLAVSEASRFLAAAFVPGDSFEDCLFAELSQRAGARLRGALAGKATPTVREVLRILETAIDTPDDTIEPTNFFEYFAVLALLGVTDGLRQMSLDRLEETHRPGSAKYQKARAGIEESFDQYTRILRGGLRSYGRIDAILSLKGPDGGRVFGGLPLAEHVAAR